MHDESNNPWQTLSKEIRYENPWIRVEEAQVIHPGGGPGIYGTVHFKNVATGVVALDDDGHIWLVGQYRYPLDAYSWEIPEGGAPDGENPLEAAKRELQEETGLTARKWDLLLKIHLSNSVSDELAYIYMARELTPGPPAPEEVEDLAVQRISLEKAYEMVLHGKIMDSLSVTAILHAFHLWQHGDLSP